MSMQVQIFVQGVATIYRALQSLKAELAMEQKTQL